MVNEQNYSSPFTYSLPAHGKGSALAKWPFRHMKVGEYILVEDKSNWSNATSCSVYAANRYGMKFKRTSTEGVLKISRVS